MKMTTMMKARAKMKTTTTTTKRLVHGAKPWALKYSSACSIREFPEKPRSVWKLSRKHNR
jgi:hypothetical protein